MGDPRFVERALLEEAVQSAGEAARRVPGVDGVTSFLTVPEPGSEKLLHGLLP